MKFHGVEGRNIREIVSEKSPDYFITACVAFLIFFGLVMLASASADLGKIKFDDNFYFIKHQLLRGFLPGLIGFLLALKIYYGAYEKYSFLFLAFNVLLLLLIFSNLGLSAKGAERWLELGPLSIQPSEILKLSFIVYLAAWLSGEKERQYSLYKGFIPFIAILGILGSILLKQSSTSMFGILLITALIIYLMSGAKLSYLWGALLIGLISIASISYFSPYRWNRITTYLKPDANLETTGFHINQARIAIGAGGLTGVGLGQSTTKISYLPEPIGDSIFAIISEELGFLGAATIIIVFALLSIRILAISKKIPDKFGRLLLMGFGSLIGVQAFINIGAISGLIPLTGMPLPFISFGGTALTVFMTMSGIILNISKYAR